MRKTHNGFVTLFVTWLGFVVFSFSLAVAVLAERHWQEVRTFSHATRAAYLAENALEIGKERYSQKNITFPAVAGNTGFQGYRWITGRRSHAGPV